MARIYDDVTKLIGNTPLVRLNRITDGAGATVVGQARVLQPGQLGQGPHRRRDHRRGRAVRRAASPAARSSRRPAATPASRSRWSARPAATTSCSPCRRPCPRSAGRCCAPYGAELILTPGPRGHEGRRRQGRGDRRGAPGAVLARQFANEANPEIHRTTTAEEIWDDTDGEVDIVVAGIGTGGTITGVGQVLKERKPDVQIDRRRAGRVADPQRRPARPAQDPGHRRRTSCPRSSTATIYDEIIDVDAETSVAVGPPRRRPRRACWSASPPARRSAAARRRSPSARRTTAS